MTCLLLFSLGDIWACDDLNTHDRKRMMFSQFLKGAYDLAIFTRRSEAPMELPELISFEISGLLFFISITFDDVKSERNVVQNVLAVL